MITHTGVALFICGLLTVGLIAAIVQPDVRDIIRTKKTVHTVTVTKGVLGSDSSANSRYVVTRLAVPVWKSSVRVSAFLRECRQSSPDDTSRLLVSTAQTNEGGALIWNQCAVGIRRLQSPNALPDGRLLLEETTVDGNKTTGFCAAGIVDWRFAGISHLIRKDNEAKLDFDPPGPVVACAGYIYRQQPSVGCDVDIYGVLIVGFPSLQRLSQTLPTVRINGVRLRPRYPWRDQRITYRVTSAWGLSFEPADDGSFLSLVNTSFTTSDLLTDTIVRSTCDTICRPFPVDIMVCKDECPCVEQPTTASPTTTASLTATTTLEETTVSATTLPVLPICSYQTSGAVCNVASVDYNNRLLVNTTIAAVTASNSFEGSNQFVYVSPDELSFPIIITRPPRCIYDCLIDGTVCGRQPNDGNEGDSDGYASLWTVDQAAFTTLGVSGTYTLHPFAAFAQNDTVFSGITVTQPPPFGFHMMANTPGLLEYTYRTLERVKSHGHHTDQSDLFVTGDCCYSYDTPGLRINAMRAQTVVFFAMASSAQQTGNFDNVFAGFQVLFYIPHTTVISDTRLPTDRAPSASVCVIAFDSIDHTFLLPMSFVRWEARDNTSKSIASGPLSYTCTADSGCTIRIIVDGRTDWHLLVWTLQTDNDADVRVQVLTPFSPTLIIPESCNDDGNVNQIRSDQQSSTVPLVRMAARVISVVDTQCNPHDITPTDDALAILHTIMTGGNISTVCKGVCFDARS